MRRILVVLVSLFVAGGGAAQDPPASGAPPLVKSDAKSDSLASWRYNPRARTMLGIERLAEGRTEAALAAFDQALALAPDDALLQFNAGTASLLGNGEPAIDLLGAASEAAPPELGADAFYNLGNAHLAARDPAAAIEAFEQSLRLDPGKLDAKHNLELAQRLLEQQQQEEQRQDRDNGEADPKEQPQQGEQEQDQERRERGDERPQDEAPSQPDEREAPDDRRQPLPDFEEQPEMTAEQAATILEAVENLEREQRRKQALEQRKRSKGDRDW